MQKVNPSELASLELHLNFRFFRYTTYCVSCFLYAELDIFFEFNLSPEILLKLSKISTSVSNDFGSHLGQTMHRQQKVTF